MKRMLIKKGVKKTEDCCSCKECLCETKKRDYDLLTIVIGVIVLICIMFGLKCCSAESTKKIKVFKLENDSIETLYSIKEIKSESFNKSSDGKNVQIDYISDNVKEEDIESYKSYLVNESFSTCFEENTIFSFVKESSTEGYIIHIKAYYQSDNKVINDSNTETTLVYDKLVFVYEMVEGSLNNYDYRKELGIDMQEVGYENYGYINVPNDWIVYNDDYSGDTIQYSDNAKNNIVTLNYGINKEYDVVSYSINIKKEYENIGFKVILERELISSYNTYKLSISTKDDSNYYSNIWIYEDNKGYMHYLSIETKNNNKEVLNYINSYYLGK